MKNIDKIDDFLQKFYPINKIELQYSSEFELAVAVILSAQCTDKRVNLVTKKLFEVANTPQKMLELGEKQIYEIIKPCGLGNSKTRALMDLSKQLIEKYNGKLPQDFDEITKIRGIGRKTANVLLSQLFGQDRFAVDTHVFRVCNRLGICNATSPLQTERQVIKKFKRQRLSSLHLQMVMFGRYHCKSRNPNCQQCQLQNICKYYKEKKCL